MKLKNLSIIIPVKNECNSLKFLIPKFLDTASPYKKKRIQGFKPRPKPLSGGGQQHLYAACLELKLGFFQPRLLDEAFQDQAFLPRTRTYLGLGYYLSRC